jgi:hypothetical protein
VREASRGNQLQLQADAGGILVPATWAGPLVALGARLARQPPPARGSRLIVAITVPTRDFAAVLVAAGWALTRGVEPLPEVEHVLARLEVDTPVRMLINQRLIADRYRGVEVVGEVRRVRVGPSGA